MARLSSTLQQSHSTRHTSEQRERGRGGERETRDEQRDEDRETRRVINKAADERTIAFIVISLFPPDICWLDIWFIRSTSNDRRGTSLQHGTH